MYRVHFIEYNVQFIHIKVEAVMARSIFYLTMLGTLNYVLSATEKFGGATSLAEIEPFRKCVADCEMLDIAAVGSLFTWNNKQKPEERIYSRLDRFLGKAKELLPLVRNSWDYNIGGTHSFMLAKNLKNLKPELKKLNREGFSDIEKATGMLERQLEEMQQKLGTDPSDLQLISHEYEIAQKLKEMQIARDSFLYQKAKNAWIKEGD
ncbi:uncharacterized protein LOC141588426 [Silene latifolia]|uniref:uncharacterized protein LOC141588426 n=1 Tax=Silene latifolia TaxID=37657 RepID=UPI003D7755B2